MIQCVNVSSEQSQRKKCTILTVASCFPQFNAIVLLNACSPIILFPELEFSETKRVASIEDSLMVSALYDVPETFFEKRYLFEP